MGALRSIRALPLVAVVVAASVGITAVPGTAAPAGTEPAGSAALKCKSGYVVTRLRATERGRRVTVRRCCPRGYSLRQYRRQVNQRVRYSYRCVKPKTQAPTTPQTPTAPTTPTTPQVDPKERMAALMHGKKLIYFSASTVGEVSGSTERQIEFCTNDTFNYRYIYQGTYSFTEQHASGTWKVEEAAFDDTAGNAQARISYVSYNPDVLQSGQFVLSIIGTKVYVDQTEYAVDAGSC